MKVVLVLALFVCVVSCVTIPLPTSEEETVLAFGKFSEVYGKSYSSQAEKNQRYTIFRENIKNAKEMNDKAVGAEYGITKFMDLHPAEFKHMYLGYVPSKTPAHEFKYDGPALSEGATLPAEFDWRNHKPAVVTPVKNQGQCGSCWAFSTAETIESAWALASHTLIGLSEQQIVDCDKVDDGCGGGNPPTAYEYVIHAGGLETEKEYPYKAENGQCAFKKSEVKAEIKSWHYITQDRNETEMQVKLMQQGPLSVCVDAMTWQYYTGGVIAWGDGCWYSLDHCVMITGFSKQEKYDVWNVRNSWGTDWGINGYLYVERGYDLCGIADEVTIAVAK